MKNITILTTCLIIACGTTACGLADIRPDNMKETISTAQQDKGKTLVQQMLQAHGGLDAWNAQQHVTTTFQDQWTNWLFFQITPYAQNNQRASLEAHLHHFPHSRIEFLEGDNASETWMVTDDTIQRLKEERLTTQKVQEDTFFSVFVLNPELMVGIPFRLTSADQIAYAGTRRWKGKTYDLVLLSWDTFSPEATQDQWLLYLDQDTHQLAATEFTVRMSGDGQVAFYAYQDFKQVNGMLLPHRMDAYLDKNDDEPLHIYRFGALQFSALNP